MIEKVSADYRLPVQAIERVEEEGYSWVDTFVSGLGGMHDEVAIVHRLRDSVRALAEQGNVVLVGHGCVFMTRDLPGGLHIRIVAPLRRRIENLARLMNVSTDEAAGRLRQSQRKWDRFLRRFWPLQSMKPETFAATLNSAVLSEDQVLHCVASLVK